MITWVFLAEQAGKSHLGSRWPYSGSLPPHSACLLHSLFQAGVSLWQGFPQSGNKVCSPTFEAVWGGIITGSRCQISHILHTCSQAWKTEESPWKLKTQNRRPGWLSSAHPHTWYQILLQPDRRSWKPAHYGKSSLKKQKGAWFSQARPHFYSQQISTSTSPDELLSYFKIPDTSLQTVA